VSFVKPSKLKKRAKHSFGKQIVIETIGMIRYFHKVFWELHRRLRTASVADPDLNHFRKPDPDQHPHQSQKPDPDPHHSQIRELERLRSQNGDEEAQNNGSQ
jgi:hypothetical protein